MRGATGDEAAVRAAAAEREAARLRLEIVGHEKAATLMNAGMGSLTERYDESKHEARRLRAAMARLADAADAFLADQAGATHPLCGLVQPVTVAECEELTAAVEAARKAMAGGTTG